MRLSVALMVAVTAYRSLSLGSGYWVPLTVLFVLKPDYGTTIARGIGRAIGTMAGVTIAWAIVTLFSPSDAAIVVLARTLSRRGVRGLPCQLRAVLGCAGCARRTVGGVQRRLRARRADAALGARGCDPTDQARCTAAHDGLVDPLCAAPESPER